MSGRDIFLGVAVFALYLSSVTGDGIAAEGSGRVEIAPREWGCYQAHLPDNDSVRWRAEWLLERVEEGPPAVYVGREELKGRFGRKNLDQTRLTEARFLLDEGRTRMIHSLLTVMDRSGKKIFLLEKEFDHQRGVVRTKTTFPDTGKTRRQEFEMGAALVDIKDIVLYLRRFPFPSPAEVKAGKGGDRALEFKLLNETPETYSVRVVHQGIEEVTTPAGVFSCHKLRLVLDLGILTFVGKLLAPDLYMWFTVEPPHFWVRYQGMEEGPKTPVIISELVEFHTAPPASP